MKVTAERFALAYEAVSMEETRYYLNGVFVQPHHEKGAILVSTDGHRMIVIHDQQAEVSESAIVTLPKFARQQLAPRRGFKLETKWLDISVADKTARIYCETAGKGGEIINHTDIMTAHGVIIEGTYPDWRRACPKGEMEPMAASGLNSRYVASLAKFSTKFDSNNRGGMYFMKPKGQGDDGPVMIRWGNVHDVFAVLMPFRTDFEMRSPEFIDLPSASE